MSTKKYTNRLIAEGSPYLQQHAHNPVDWFPWGDDAFEKAKSEDKLVLVSIGYSACHWCHVMERESFENEEIAAVMNKFFVNVKVDREERPDVDAIYMSAVQLMSGQGGWPLNCFILPNGKPVYGGTYFKPEQFMQILHQLHGLYIEQKEKVIAYAEKLTKGIKEEENALLNENLEFVRFREPQSSQNSLLELISNWKNRFDNIEGGPNKSPKFMLPNNYSFLLQFGVLKNDEDVLKHVELTLDKMAMGGIYDQIGGGFARYSTDMIWKVPHFEKMLYDNAQLISLYSQAYRYFKKDLYKETVYQTIDFLERELKGKNGEYFSALDADSEGEEGKFYVWTKDELKNILKDDYDIASDYYDLNGIAHWENGNYILLRRESDEEFCQRKNIEPQLFLKLISETKNKLLKERNKRTRPRLDNKSLTSWNALMISGLCEAYQSFEDDKFLKLAEENLHFLLSNQLNADGSLLHSYHNDKGYIQGFLEDYAFLTEALIHLYECTGIKDYIMRAHSFTQFVLTNFYEEGIFYFTLKNQQELIARKSEIYDNVIPSSASVMVKNLFLLSKFLDEPKWEEIAETCLSKIYPLMSGYGSAFSNWAISVLYRESNFYEIAITGENAKNYAKTIQKEYLPNKVLCFSKDESSLPLLTSRLKKNQTLVYICRNKSCNLPLETVEETIRKLKNDD